MTIVHGYANSLGVSIDIDTFYGVDTNWHQLVIDIDTFYGFDPILVGYWIDAREVSLLIPSDANWAVDTNWHKVILRVILRIKL